MPLDLSAGTPSEIWADYFSKRTPAPGDVRAIILSLHETRQHEHVIAAIEAALINGQSQPWMYEVLALSMQIAGRPQADVERILLSQVDFTAADVPSLIYSAAYLTRFGAPGRALKLYRQASSLAPTTPEPYILGLKLARELKDYDAVQWASTGILTTAWSKDHAKLHREAENAAIEAERELTKAGKPAEAEALRAAIAAAKERDLVLRLTWSGDADLDLLVEEPSGDVCSQQNAQTAGGGAFLKDGYGPNPDNCVEEYVSAQGEPGVYRARIRHVLGNVVGQRAELVIVRYQGTDHEVASSVHLTINERDQLVRIALPGGRRVAPLETRRSAQPTAAELLDRQRQRQNRLARGLRLPRAASRDASRGPAVQPSGVGFQPVVQTLSEGVSMSALAVVSGDRRYVRISTTPIFSNITDVFTFSFVNGGNPNGGGQGGGVQQPAGP